jgi:predicted ATP-grasp superfamily ATP-dependent carboligase
MVQEIIPGPDSNLYTYTVYINSEGYISAKFFRRKIRQNPPQFGVGRVVISHDRIPQLEEFTEIILKEVGFTGIAGAEFKKDSRDNKFKLIEINARMTRNNWLPTYCGVNFPWIIYMDLVEKKQLEVTDYKRDVYLIELCEDIANTIFRRKEDNLGFRDYVKPYLSRDKTFADVSSEDLVPFLKRISAWPIRHYSFSKLKKITFIEGNYE